MSSIIIIEDEMDQCMTIARLIDRMGCEAITLATGEAALVYLRSTRADLVLVDTSLPGMSGFDVLRTIRLLPHQSDVPVVMLGTSADPRVRDEALSSGANAYWVKGNLDPDEMHRSILQWLHFGSYPAQHAMR